MKYATIGIRAAVLVALAILVLYSTAFSQAGGPGLDWFVTAGGGAESAGGGYGVIGTIGQSATGALQRVAEYRRCACVLGMR